MSNAQKKSVLQSIIVPLLLLVIVAGFALRIWNVNFDRGIGSHPDERSTACFYAPGIRLPSTWAEFTDPKRSPMNPLWDVARQERRGFTYGHFPLYLGVAMGEVLHQAAPLAEAIRIPEQTVALMSRADHGCDAIAVAGRLVMALLDTLTILLLFLLGRRIYSPLAGLLAAAFYAFTAQAIQLSHFFAMDPASTTFTVLAVLGGVKMAQDRNIRAALWTGLGAGLAISSKFSALPVLAVPIAAAILVFWDVAQARAQLGEEPANGSRDEFRTLIGVFIAFGVAILTFAVTSPYAVLDWENFIQATLVEQGRMVRGVADFPFTRQYRNTWPYIYFIEQQWRWGLGWALGLVAAAGTVVALVNLVRSLFSMAVTVIGRLFANVRWRVVLQDRQAELIVWAWVVPYFGITGAFLAKFNRYMLPVLPFVVLFGAGMIWRLWRMGGEGREARGEDDALGPDASTLADISIDEGENGPLDENPRPSPLAPRLLAIALATLAITGGLFWSLAYVNGVYDREHTWISASRWIYENVPEGSAILWELWDDPLPKSIPGEAGMDMGSTGLYNIDWSPYEEDTAEKYEIMRDKLQDADYVVYSSKRIHDSVDELPERYPMTNLYYRSMWDGSLGFELALDQTSPPALLGFTFDDRDGDESWSLYDHPQVTVFRKVRQLSDAEYDAIFADSWRNAIHWYRGKDSPISPLLAAIGLGSSPESEESGLINWVIELATGESVDHGGEPASEERPSLALEPSLNEQPSIPSYRWNSLASENRAIGILWWWFVVAALGWLAWPYAFGLFRPLRDRGYLFSRGLGWLLSGWLLWWLASLGWVYNTQRNAWIMVLILGIGGAFLASRQRQPMRDFLRRRWGLLLAGEILFAIAYLLFIFVRMGNPDIWQPWFGGEKFMEFAFLNGILRSPTFPPLDPHFANGYINYYYFGIYLVAFLTKLTGIYAEVAFNLAIPTLFAMTVTGAFAVAYSSVRLRVPRLATQDLRGRQDTETTADHEPSPSEDQSSSAAGPDEREASPRIEGRGADTAPLARRTWEEQEDAPSIALAGSEESKGVVANRSESDESEASLRVETETAPLAPQTWGEWDTETTADHEPHLSEDQSGSAAELDENESWRDGFWAALLAPLFVTLIGNLDGFVQVASRYAQRSTLSFSATVPGVDTVVNAISGVAAEPELGSYDFWGPSRVIPNTINEFPYWSFLFADLHPHLIGIPFSLLFLGLILTLLLEPVTDWFQAWKRGLVLAAGLALMLGTLATVNLWELPTYLGLGMLAFIVSQYYRQGRIRWLQAALFGLLYLAGAFIAYWPFFDSYTNIGASGVGLVREGDEPGRWLLIWGLFAFVLFSWLLYAASRRARSRIDDDDAAIRPSGIERVISLAFHQFDRLPRVVYLHGRLVKRPTLLYQLGLWLLPATLLFALGAIWWGRSVLALCLPFLGLATLLLWRRGREADAGSVFTVLLTATGLAVLAGTQVIYLKDFLQGGDWYRMNTLFKFFSQIWVIWGVAAAIAVPRVWHGWIQRQRRGISHSEMKASQNTHRFWRYGWAALFLLLLFASFFYPVLGTPARLAQRLDGWTPPYGTLNGLDYMREGVYTWPDGNNRIELAHDWAAIQWLLENVHGSPVTVESSEVGYYRAGGSRVTSLTGLSGLRGMHASEQRYGDLVGARDGFHREFWETSDIERTQALIEKLDIALIYAGQLEQHQHPAGVEKLEAMAEQGLLTPIYRNERVTIYAVPDNLSEREDGGYQPS